MNKKSYFKLVTRKDKEGLLENLDQKYKEEYSQSLFDEDEGDQNQYLCYIHEGLGLIGGAKITPDTVKKPFVEDYLSRNNYSLGKFWQVSHIFFSPPRDAKIQQGGEDFNQLCQKFYQDLRLCLYMFRNSVWVVVNYSEEHENTKYFGGWKYAIEHIFHEDFVLGCLENNLQNPSSLCLT